MVLESDEYGKSLNFLNFCKTVSEGDYDLRFIRGMVCLIIADYYVKYEDGLFELHPHKEDNEIDTPVIKTFRIDTFAMRIIKFINDRLNYNCSLNKLAKKYAENLKYNNLRLKEIEEKHKIERETYQQKIKQKEENKKLRELNLQKHLMDLEAQKETEAVYQRDLELKAKVHKRRSRNKYIYEDMVDPEIYGGLPDIILSNPHFLKRIRY